jgi:hypothetical protein
MATLHLFSAGSGLTLNWEKPGAFYWDVGNSQQPTWTYQFAFQWVSKDNVSKLLGTPFGITLATEAVNQFLLDRTDKKLQHWTAQKLNSTGRSVIYNDILTSATMYFLAI